MPRRYDLKDYSGMLANMNDDLKKTLEAAALSAGFKIVQYIQTSVIPATQPQPVDRGLYRAGWKAKPIKNGVYVFNRVPHASFVEYGVRNVVPGKKTIDALTKWVKRKGIGSRVVTGKGGKMRVKKPTAQQARQIAYAIAMGAKKKGGFFNRGTGLKVFGKAMKQAKRIFKEEITSFIAKGKIG